VIHIGLHSWQDYRSSYIQVTSLLESEGITLVYYSSDHWSGAKQKWTMVRGHCFRRTCNIGHLRYL